MKAQPEIPNATKHGLYTLKKAVARLGNKVINKRYSTGRALAKWRSEIVADLGGLDNISAQQSAVIDLAVKNNFLLDSIDVWLFSQKSLVNKKKKALLPVVKERQSLADGLAKYLAMLGLERRKKEVSLEDYFNEKYGKDEESQR